MPVFDLCEWCLSTCLLFGLYGVYLCETELDLMFYCLVVG